MPMVDAGKALDQEGLEAVESSLTRALVWWAAGSVVLGGALALIGRQHPTLAGFGRQAAMWGAIDGAIAGVGALTRRGRGSLTAEQVTAKARSLRVVLLANAMADVGYVAGGLVVAARARTGRPVLRMGAGDGVGIVVQGVFLLALDASQARRLSAHRMSGQVQ